jgi:molecular chaperone DnaK
VEINSAVDVSDEAVEAMISESLEHAFDDMSERVWTEAKLKAGEMLSAVDTALAQVGDGIGLPEKEKIVRAATEVREALTTHDARKLQTANSALDEATQGLAAALVTKALEAAS